MKFKNSGGIRMKKILFSMLFVAVCAIASSESFELTVRTLGLGSGTVVGKLANGTTVITCKIQPPATCTQKLLSHSIVTLTAAPDTGHTFLGWRLEAGSAAAAAACTGTAPCP